MGKMDIMDNMDIQILRQAARNTQGTPAHVFDLDVSLPGASAIVKKVLGRILKYYMP